LFDQLPLREPLHQAGTEGPLFTSRLGLKTLVIERVGTVDDPACAVFSSSNYYLFFLLMVNFLMTAGDDGLAVTSYNYAAWEAWRGDCIYSSENFFVVGLVAEI